METHNELGEQDPRPAETQTGESHPMDALLKDEAYSLETPRRGEIRVGTVARVTESDVLVDIGAKSEGVIRADEVQSLPEERRGELTVGREVTVYVLRVGGQDGMILLSIKKAEEEADWNWAEKLLETEENYEGEITGYNKGGLIIKVGNLRGFVPASQVSLSRRRRAQGSSPDQRWGKMVDEPMVAKVIEVDRRRNRLILSERAATKEAREVLKERLIEELEPGEVRTGHVISLADFGAFVDIGGADGLVHTSELSWKRVTHPSEVLKVGQEVRVKVLDLDTERNRISLSLRELEEDPWDTIARMFQEGQLIEGTITKLTNFGAFARLKETEEYEVEGLIHISELADRRIEHPSEIVEEGENLTLRIIKVDPERRRIGLSLRKVDSTEYVDLDWKRSVGEGEAPAATTPAGEWGGPEEEVVEDFDAALEAEAPAGMKADEFLEETAAAEAEASLEEPEQDVEEVEPTPPEPAVEPESPAPAEGEAEVLSEATIEGEESAELAEEVEPTPPEPAADLEPAASSEGEADVPPEETIEGEESAQAGDQDLEGAGADAPAIDDREAPVEG